MFNKLCFFTRWFFYWGGCKLPESNIQHPWDFVGVSHLITNANRVIHKSHRWWKKLSEKWRLCGGERIAFEGSCIKDKGFELECAQPCFFSRFPPISLRHLFLNFYPLLIYYIKRARSLLPLLYYTLCALSLSALCFLWSSPFIFAARAAALIPSWGRNERKEWERKSESAELFLLRTRRVAPLFSTINARVLCKSQRAAQWRRARAGEILKLSDAANAKCCAARLLLLQRRRRVSSSPLSADFSKKFSPTSAARAAKSCASRKIFTSALALSLSCHFSFAGCYPEPAFQEHSRAVRSFID